MACNACIVRCNPIQLLQVCDMLKNVILIFFECNAIYVKDVEDVNYNQEDVEDGKRTYTYISAYNFLNIQPIFNPQKVLES